jgi:hypothetical protein
MGGVVHQEGQQSVTKIFTDFALFSGLVAFVFAIVLAAVTLLT